MTENNIAQVGDVLRWNPTKDTFDDFTRNFGPGPFLVRKIMRHDSFEVVSVAGPRQGETNIFCMNGLCLDVFLTEARRACAKTKKS